nr:hypothetical protein [Tanacetum cinerariifolium]
MVATVVGDDAAELKRIVVMVWCGGLVMERRWGDRDEVMGDDEVMEMVMGMTMVRREMVRWRRLEVIGCGGRKSR